MFYKEIGTDPQTGWPILLCPNQVIRYRMPKCLFCGKTDVISYSRRMFKHLPCDECGRFLQSFMQAKSRLNSRTALDNFKKKLDILMYRKEKGYIVPDNLDAAVRFYEYLDKQLPEPVVRKIQTYTDYCRYCGETMEIRVGENRCIRCADRYKDFRRLSAKVTNLSVAEYNRLTEVLDEYAVLMRKGRRVPNISKVRKKMKGPV